MKVFNLHPLLFSNIMVFFNSLLRSLEIILYLDPLTFPLGGTIWSFESGGVLEESLVTEKKGIVMLT